MEWLKRQWALVYAWVKRYVLASKLRAAGAVVALILVIGGVVQLSYPNGTLLPFSTVGGVSVGGLQKADAVKKISAAYANVKVPVYFTSDTKPKVSPSYKDLGMTAEHGGRVEALSYPWYMRLVPTSLAWYGMLQVAPELDAVREVAVLDSYFEESFGRDCRLEPANAGLKVANGKLEVVPAKTGGECEYDEVYPALKNVSMSLEPQKIVVKGTTIQPDIDDSMAEAEKARVEALIAKGVQLTADGRTGTIPAKELYDWLTYTVKDGKLTLALDGQRSSKWLTDTYGAQFAVAPGVTTVVTRDFTELSRQTGTNGQAVDTDATRASLEAQLQGKATVSEVAVRVVPPTITYERSYSSTDTGLSALLKNFASENTGTYGASLVELTGKKRRAEYNASKQFTAASTYKLFVAYSAMLRVEDGRWKLTDQVHGGRDVAKCIEDSLALSDNPCSEEMLRRVGFSELTNEARAIGATGTSFLGSDGIKTTARDQAVFMGALHSGQLLSKQSSRDRLLGAMKRGIHRQGIAAGVSGATITNKVGFLDRLLHDSSIVQVKGDTYVLVIMTEGASWGKIAELAREVEKLRSS